MLCSHQYLRVKRKIEDNEQVYEEYEEEIQVYADRITTASDHFDIKDVLDITFKTMSGDRGFLYLHTTRGVYSYFTNANPEQLMEIYQKIKAQK
ncbi:hypothetical protein [Mesobacillus subterraneus]|uniref:Uncharacterized protein n=1 Tax=Mesobacillus subterraneus TaxID=285983 RepID=A0A3R9E3P8_9BACI|nr:hypothetical protein [Mesobacillus subterraneus]RSD25426.1 hypothetical protein EJA10_16590 [Mesobacillus subterraneus]